MKEKDAKRKIVNLQMIKKESNRWKVLKQVFSVLSVAASFPYTQNGTDCSE